MAIKPKKVGKPVIDLSGPQGNAYNLLGVAEQLCKKLQMEFEPIYAEMTSGDYENLIQVFDKHFGYYVDLQR